MDKLEGIAQGDVAEWYKISERNSVDKPANREAES